MSSCHQTPLMHQGQSMDGRGNTKLQTPSSRESPISNLQNWHARLHPGGQRSCVDAFYASGSFVLVWFLVFGFSLELGCWCLDVSLCGFLRDPACTNPAQCRSTRCFGVSVRNRMRVTINSRRRSKFIAVCAALLEKPVASAMSLKLASTGRHFERAAAA
jgi:hypothetical protein